MNKLDNPLYSRKGTLIIGILSILSALALSFADFILEFNPDSGVSTTSIIETVWEYQSSWRFILSLNLCGFFIPFYLGGFWLLYRLIAVTSKKMAFFLSLLFSYGLVMGAPLVHSAMCLNPLIFQFGRSQGLSIEVLGDLIEGILSGAIMPVFITHYVITWIVCPIILFIYIIRGKSILPRWSAFLNPLVCLIIGLLGQMFLPEVFIYLSPGSINKGNVLLFSLLTWRLVKNNESVSEDFH